MPLEPQPPKPAHAFQASVIALIGLVDAISHTEWVLGLLVFLNRRLVASGRFQPLPMPLGHHPTVDQVDNHSTSRHRLLNFRPRFALVDRCVLVVCRKGIMNYK